MFALYQNRFVCTVVTTSRADCHADYIGERNEPGPICYIHSLINIAFYSRIETMSTYLNFSDKKYGMDADPYQCSEMLILILLA